MSRPSITGSAGIRPPANATKVGSRSMEPATASQTVPGATLPGHQASIEGIQIGANLAHKPGKNRRGVDRIAPLRLRLEDLVVHRPIGFSALLSHTE
mgnify:CR=1 FL=1